MSKTTKADLIAENAELRAFFERAEGQIKNLKLNSEAREHHIKKLTIRLGSVVEQYTALLKEL